MGILWVEARDVAQQPTMHSRLPTTKNDQAPNFKNAKVENSCSIVIFNTLYYDYQFYFFPSRSWASQRQGHCQCTPCSSRCLAHSRCSINIGKMTEEGKECPDGLMKHYPRNWIPGRHDGSLNGYCIRKFQLQDVFPLPFQEKIWTKTFWIQSHMILSARQAHLSITIYTSHATNY